LVTTKDVSFNAGNAMNDFSQSSTESGSVTALVKIVHQRNSIKMKKIFFVLAVVCTFVTAGINCAYAQDSKKSAESNSEKNFLPSIRKLVSEENPALTGIYIMYPNEINIRAIRDFQDRFNNVDNALWYAEPNGNFVSYFVQDGYGDRVIYDKKGRWQFSLITLGEDKLPVDIRAAVKSTYYDLTIALAEVVKSNEGVEYIIYLEDESNIKVVKVSEGREIELLRELNRE
jgi:hypothetical protein